MILAGDIGGTKTLLALASATEPRVLWQQRYDSAGGANFSDLLAGFLQQAAQALASQFSQGLPAISAAGFGIAGPIGGVPGAQQVKATNLPWQLDSAEISVQLGGVPVVFANDLVASGTAAIFAPAAAKVALNPAARVPACAVNGASAGHVAVIAAGTGLGEALFYYDGARHHPMPTEGGHSDFAPNSALESELWAYMRAKLDGHVSYERILCGKGFVELYEFAKAQGLASETAHMQARLAKSTDPSAVITAQAVAGSDALSEIACQLFARIYGAEAGNLALKSLPMGGVFVAGAIAGHILPFMQREFMQGFLNKGRFTDLLRQIPVWVVSDPDLALKGALQLAMAGLE
jgi:glucokinase